MPIDILGGREAEQCTPHECALAIQGKALELNRSQGLDTIPAWRRACGLYPTVAARIRANNAGPVAPEDGEAAAGVVSAQARQECYNQAYGEAIARNPNNQFAAHQAGLAAMGGSAAPVTATTATDGPAIDASLANAYKEALAVELARNGGDLNKAHEVVIALPTIAGKLNWPTLRNPFPMPGRPSPADALLNPQTPRKPITGDVTPAMVRGNGLGDPVKVTTTPAALGNDAALAGAVALANSGGDFYFPKNYKPGEPFIMRLASPDCLA